MLDKGNPIASQPLSRFWEDACKAVFEGETLHSKPSKERTAPHRAKIVGFTCIRCSASYPITLELDSRGCPACHEAAPANLRPVYDPPLNPSAIVHEAPRSLWRYDHALPCAAQDAVSL